MTGHWKAVSEAAIKDLNIVAGAIITSDEQEAADRLLVLLGALAALDTEHEESSVIDAISFYIGYRHGRVRRGLPFAVRPRDIQVPAAHIMDLITHDKTLPQLTAEVDEEIP